MQVHSDCRMLDYWPGNSQGDGRENTRWVLCFQHQITHLLSPLTGRRYASRWMLSRRATQTTTPYACYSCCRCLERLVDRQVARWSVVQGDGLAPHSRLRERGPAPRSSHGCISPLPPDSARPPRHAAANVAKRCETVSSHIRANYENPKP